MQDCGGQLTEHNGTFTSPGYPADYPGNVNCEWTIKVPKDHVILLYSNSFNLEYPYYCRDRLDIYERSLLNNVHIGGYLFEYLFIQPLFEMLFHFLSNRQTSQI